jgi:hypothetical protein
MYRIGIIGLPPKKLLEKYLSGINKEEIVDLDMPLLDSSQYYHPIERRFPKIYCAILKTVFVNALVLKPEVILADVGKGKCDGSRYLIQILKKVLKRTKIIAEENRDREGYGFKISTSNLPLKKKMELIVEGIVSEKKLNLEFSPPTVGFWGVPPRDFSILDLFPDSTHIFGWSRCLENKTPDNLELEMKIDPHIPMVFFSQSFCQKSSLARYLANRYQGLYVEMDSALDYSAKSKILAFLSLKGVI